MEMKPKIIKNGSPRCINAVLTNLKDSILIALEMQIVSTFHKQNDSPQLSFTFCKAWANVSCDFEFYERYMR